MKIFSNFDTHFRDKVLSKRKEVFRDEEILIITRSWYYFFFRVLIPFTILVCIGVGFLVIFQKYTIGFYFTVPFILAWIFIAWFRMGHKLLKYLYDFTIVDPKGVTTYKQRGILHSSLKQIPANRIRSIQICRNNILENIFGYGSIDIHTDYGDNMHIGQDDESPSVIGLTYVDTPYKIKVKITDLCFK